MCRSMNRLVSSETPGGQLPRMPAFRDCTLRDLTAAIRIALQPDGEHPMGRKPLSPEQREKRRASLKAWREKHKEHLRAYDKRWHEKHREQRLAYDKRWHEENRERVLVRQKRRYKENQDRIKEARRQRYRALKESNRAAAEPAAD
jgi:hypothetical protein